MKLTKPEKLLKSAVNELIKWSTYPFQAFDEQSKLEIQIMKENTRALLSKLEKLKSEN